jgi:hypothetical protein
MTALTTWLRSLGNAGALANAWRACEERRIEQQRVDALAARLDITHRAAS